jgi:hypothetical protein
MAAKQSTFEKKGLSGGKIERPDRNLFPKPNVDCSPKPAEIPQWTRKFMRNDD